MYVDPVKPEVCHLWLLVCVEYCEYDLNDLSQSIHQAVDSKRHTSETVQGGGLIVVPAIPPPSFAQSVSGSHMSALRIRKYPHFDGDLTLAEAEALVTDPTVVSQHSFFPFIESAQHWTKFAVKGLLGDKKDRPIRYAARKDSCIYSHYREILVPLYEARLKSLSIENQILAYRRIPKAGGGNKSNIDFANDAFEKIAQLGDCFAYALDISKFFENIDHSKLKSVWADLLGLKRLPKNHHQVYKSITKFAWVDKEALYKRLRFIGEKQRSNGKITSGYLVKRVPLQVCSGKVFRNKIFDLIQTNEDPHGIPQGSPISDVLANMYLIDFDTKMTAALANCSGHYYRYSDDVLILVPGNQDDIKLRLKMIQDTLNSCGDKLVFSAKKSAVHRFTQCQTGSDTTQSCTLVYGNQGKNGLEYLGFRFDGKSVYIRDSTRAGLNRKIVAAAKKLARIHARANPQKTLSELESSFNFDRLIKKFGRVDEFESNTKGYRGWTFWTYAVRANEVFGSKGRPILRQLRGYKSFVRHKAKEALARYTGAP